MSYSPLMGWKDTLAALRAEIAPEGSEPPALLTELETEIQSLEVSHSDALSGADTRIQELAAAKAAQEADNLRLKGVNYDLLMASKADPGNDETGSTTNDDDAPTGIDSLFGTPDE